MILAALNSRAMSGRESSNTLLRTTCLLLKTAIKLSVIDLVSVPKKYHDKL